MILVTSDLGPLAGFGRKDVVDHLLRTGANVHARDDGGLIPLHNACSFGHSEVRLRSARVLSVVENPTAGDVDPQLIRESSACRCSD